MNKWGCEKKKNVLFFSTQVFRSTTAQSLYMGFTNNFHVH